MFKNTIPELEQQCRTDATASTLWKTPFYDHNQGRHNTQDNAVHINLAIQGLSDSNPAQRLTL